MNTEYDISILIPCYNNSSFLRDCFESIISQDLSGLAVEVLFSDNCSSDDSYAIACSYCAMLSRINEVTVNASQRNQNVGSGRNIKFLLSEAKGNIVHILCADDYYSSRNSVLKIVSASKNNPSASILIIDDNTHKRNKPHWMKILAHEGNKPIPSNMLCLYYYLYGCFVGGLSGTCIRSEAVADFVASMRVDFAYYGDFYILSSMAIQGYSLLLLEDELVFRREHPHQDSNLLNRDCSLYSESTYVLSLLSSHLFGAIPPFVCRLYCSILTGFYWVHALKYLLFRANAYPLRRLFTSLKDSTFLPPVFFLIYTLLGANYWPRFRLLYFLEKRVRNHYLYSTL